MSEAPARLRIRRTPHGRNRIPILLGAGIFSAGFLHLILTAARAVFATSIFIAEFLRAVVQITSQPVFAIVLSAVFTVFALFRMHPALQPNYRAWLATTPWSPARPLPLGSFRLNKAGLLLPLTAVAILYLVRAQTADAVAIGVVLGNALIAAVGAGVAERPKLTILLLAIALPILPAMAGDSHLTLWLSLAVLLLLSDHCHRIAIDAAFEKAKCFDARRLNTQSRSKLGYLHHLKLTDDPSQAGLLALVALTAGVGCTCFMLAFRISRGTEAINIISLILVIVQFATTVSHFTFAPLSYGPIARVLTGRWFVPRMDRLLLGPAAMVVYVAALYCLPWTRSEATPFMGGACVSGGVALALFTAIPRLKWQVLGATRIQLKPTASQKQVEAAMKRR